ncbi:cell death protein 3-like isoform X1 [Portunus trituberculatus]|uniref:cell death protein 3-like isoform X1 n=1 Tax=Portunus trituberculatus TaxID=210409 RepID=UPI001E1CCEEF|nr:cell death protein 3-like isoform X1 [Portunus trituberculatus]XP_045105929.1 cell death protein 3-like isoform X1 [Portunus trituberculatus]XP_045105930.1 cell death protein 3-like isoform X1 [Portunus trituberculatus]XP_045105931.1 cell death protein 3-like isoform X1 [Portunus trituberculatus]
MSGEEWKAVREQVEIIATEVVGWKRTRDVIHSLCQRSVLTEADMDHLMSLNSEKEQVRQLVALLAVAAAGVGGSGSNLRSFLEILQEQGMENLVKRLDPAGAHSPEPLSQDPSVFPGLQVTPFQHPLHQWAGGASNIMPIPGYPNSTFPNPGQNFTNNNEKDNLNANTTMEARTASPNSIVSSRTRLKVSVVPCREIGGKQFSKNDVYKNESEPRGYVFLANYKNFRDEQHETRSGSEIDVQNLGQLFSQMGYKPSYHINMSKWDTIKALRDFRNMKEHNNVDSCIVVFMSHGRDDTSFYTSDNNYLTVHDVVERFNNRECPILKGKPKIFIFQFCRGRGPDIGVDAARVVHMKSKTVGKSNGLEVETDSSTFGSTVPERDPTYTDMYIVYSTVGGFVSFRHPESGSWLVEAICKVFMKDACDTELEHLMKKVSREVRANFSTEGNKQACEFVQRAFDQHFFFNPKPLALLSSLDLSRLGETLPRLMPVHRRRIRTSSPSSKLKSGNACMGARRRHFSGENSTLENHPDQDVLDNSQTPALHPRVKSLSTSYRRKSASEVPNQNLFHGMVRGRSFSELNSENSPEHSETSELGATSCFSLEKLSSLEDPHQQWRNAAFHESGACGGGSVELHPDLMEEGSPHEAPKEGFPLIHSQSALEAIGVSEFGGMTGIGPEVRDAEGLRPSFKRQLSAPSNNETLQKVNDVRRYLQLNDSDEALLHPLKRIESFINKKKREGKRRKMGETNSQEY